MSHKEILLFPIPKLLCQYQREPSLSIEIILGSDHSKQETIVAHVHVTYSPKRANKDLGNRDRMLERLRGKLENPGKLKEAMKRGGNQSLQMDLDTVGAPLTRARYGKQPSSTATMRW